MIAAAVVLMPAYARSEECDALALCPVDGCTISGTHSLSDGCTLDFTGKMVTTAPDTVLQAGGAGYTITVRAGSLIHQGLLSVPGGTINLQLVGDLIVKDTGGQHGRIDVNGSTTLRGGKLNMFALRKVRLGATITATGGAIGGGAVLIEGCDVGITGTLDARYPNGGVNPGRIEVFYHVAYTQDDSLLSDDNKLHCEMLSGSSPPTCRAAAHVTGAASPAAQTFANFTQPCGGCGTKLAVAGAPFGPVQGPGRQSSGGDTRRGAGLRCRLRLLRPPGFRCLRAPRMGRARSATASISAARAARLGLCINYRRANLISAPSLAEGVSQQWIPREECT